MSKQSKLIYHVSLLSLGSNYFALNFVDGLSFLGTSELFCCFVVFFLSLFISHPKLNNNGYRTSFFLFSNVTKNKIQVKLREKLLGVCLSLCSLLHTVVSMDKILHTIHSECVHRVISTPRYNVNVCSNCRQTVRQTHAYIAGKALESSRSHGYG